MTMGYSMQFVPMRLDDKFLSQQTVKVLTYIIIIIISHVPIILFKLQHDLNVFVVDIIT